MYIDSHLHLSNDYYEDINKVIEEAYDKGVSFLIISGCDKKGIKESIEVANKFKNIYLTLGFHPNEANYIEEQDIKYLKEIVAKNKKVLAIGEIGLDYYWVKDNKEKQQKLFRKQLSLAKELKLPVIIHSRDAHLDTFSILSEYNLKGIIHCFSGSLEAAKEYISLGYLLGIGGVVTFNNSKIQEVVKEIPLESIVLETDSPYLAPTPFRGKQNSPSYIPIIAAKIAELKNIKAEEVAIVTTRNVCNLYRNME